MKKYQSMDGRNILYVGNADEIKPVYNAMYRHQNEQLFSIFEKASFNPYKLYGLSINTNGEFYVIGESALVSLYYAGELV